VLYFVAPFSIVRHLGVRREIDQETVLGAIAAYLLIGIFFAFAYRTVERRRRGRSSGRAVRDHERRPLLQLHHAQHDGIREPRPAANPGQTMAVTEAIVGSCSS